MPKEAPKTFQKNSFIQLKKTILAANRNRRPNNSEDVNARTDENLRDRNPKFVNVTNGENMAGTGGGYYLIVFFLVLLYLFPHVLSPFI